MSRRRAPARDPFREPEVAGPPAPGPKMTPEQLVALRLAVADAEVTLLAAARAFAAAEPGRWPELRVFFLACFAWRAAVRELYAVVRAAAKGPAGMLRHGTTLTESRAAEQATRQAVRDLVQEALVRAQAVEDGEHPVAAAARELARELRATRTPGKLLRVGTLRRGHAAGEWLVHPLAGGLPVATTKAKSLSPGLLGKPVLFLTDEGGRRATAVRSAGE